MQIMITPNILALTKYAFNGIIFFMSDKSGFTSKHDIQNH